MDDTTRRRASRPPALELRVELEELPTIRLVAASAEDEQRLRRWLMRPATSRRLADAVADAFDELRRSL